MKRTAVPAETPTWCCFDAYEIVEGRVRPRAGCEPQMFTLGSLDPLQAAKDLVKAVGGIETHESGWPRRTTTAGEESALKDFARKYGLLGLLHHRTLSVTFAARERLVHGYADGVPVTFDVPYQLRFERTSQGWSDNSAVHYQHYVPHGVDVTPEADVADGDDLADEPAPDIFEAARAVVQPFGETPRRVEKLVEAWAPFFPSVPVREAETFAYPAPNSSRFWAMYAEPLDEIARAAVALARIFRSGKTAAVAELDWLAAPVGLLLRPDELGTVRQVVSTPTLLSALCMAAVRAAADGARIVSCEACSALFVSDRYQARYCQPAHARRMQTRRYRASNAKKPKRRPRRR